MNRLSSSVIQNLYTDNLGKNWCYSPTSYNEVLGNLSICLKDKNLSELESVAPNIKTLRADGFETYNIMFVKDIYKLALVRDVIQELDSRDCGVETFSGPEIISLVNSRVEEKTHGKIKGLLSDSDYDELLAFVILNCVYFKKDWLYEFDKPSYDEPFFATDGTVQTQYLKYQTHYRYYEDSRMDIVELPYKDSDVKCYVIVPRDGLFSLVNSISDTVDKIGLVKAELDCHVTVPPFKVETTINLIPPTREAGVTSIFDWSKDWSMVDWDMLKPEAVMRVSAIRQKTYFDFNRKGTEAAAATAVLMQLSGCFSPLSTPPPIKYIRADKPFMFVLAKETSNPLFVGIVNKP